MKEMSKRPDGMMLFASDWENVIDDLSEREAGILLKALFRYFTTGEVVEIKNRALRFIFDRNRATLDRQVEKYRQTCERNAANARKRNQEAEEPVAPTGTRSQPTGTVTGTVTGTGAVVGTGAVDGAGTVTPNETKQENNNIIINEDNNDKDPSCDSVFRPAIEEIRAYCEERKNGIDAEQFYDYYASKGWMLGNSPMRDWKSAVRNWERRSRSEHASDKGPGTKPAEVRPVEAFVFPPPPT